MPHIHIMVPNNEPDIVSLTKTKSFKDTLIDIFSKHFEISKGEVTIIGHIISGDALEMSENLLPLKITIDIGMQCEPLNDLSVQDFVELLLEDSTISTLKNYPFAVWVREMSSNGFHEHSKEDD